MHFSQNNNINYFLFLKILSFNYDNYFRTYNSRNRNQRTKIY